MVVKLDKNIFQEIHMAVTEFVDKISETDEMAGLIVLSHGEDGRIHASDGRLVDLNSIIEPLGLRFDGTGLSKVIPKLVIVQACRSSK